jgi:hypothetical protein
VCVCSRQHAAAAVLRCTVLCCAVAVTFAAAAPVKDSHALAVRLVRVRAALQQRVDSRECGMVLCGVDRNHCNHERRDPRDQVQARFDDITLQSCGSVAESRAATNVHGAWVVSN